MHTNHTPGPWKATSRIRVALTHDLPEIQFCAAHEYKGPEVANARLIAAAPELLEALQQIREMTEGATGGMHGDIFEIAVTALAKAEGRE